MALDPAALRQALEARAMQMAPAEAPAMEPAMEGQFQEQPPMDMPPDGMNMLDPAVQLEMEKARVKEMLKRVRGTELEQEVQALIQARQADIDGEATELFQNKKSGR